MTTSTKPRSRGVTGVVVATCLAVASFLLAGLTDVPPVLPSLLWLAALALLLVSVVAMTRAALRAKRAGR
jgi:hypothetical protein